MMFSKSNGPADPIKEAESADRDLGHALASWREKPIVELAARMGEIGDQGPLYLIGSGIALIGLFRRKPDALVAGLSMVAAVAAADVMKSTIKNHVKRSRPDHAMEEGSYRFEAGGSPRKEEQSFPSGHVACTVAAAGAISRFYPKNSPYLRCVTGLISFTRVIKGKHWPADLIAGMLVGVTADWLVKTATPDRVIEKITPQSPSAH